MTLSLWFSQRLSLLLPLLQFSTGGRNNPSDPPAIHLKHWSRVLQKHWAEVASSCPPNLLQPPAQLLPGPQMAQFLVVTMSGGFFMSSGALWLRLLWRQRVSRFLSRHEARSNRSDAYPNPIERNSSSYSSVRNVFYPPPFTCIILYCFIL